MGVQQFNCLLVALWQFKAALSFVGWLRQFRKWGRHRRVDTTHMAESTVGKSPEHGTVGKTTRHSGEKLERGTVVSVEPTVHIGTSAHHPQTTGPGVDTQHVSW